MAKSSLEKTIEKQIKQAKDAERKRERDARKEATRDRAASVVNGQPIINGLRILDATSEEILKCLLEHKSEESSRVSFDDSIFPNDVQMSLGIELEKLVQYGMIGGLISYDSGGRCDMLPPALVYFENKQKALQESDNQEGTDMARKELKILIDQGKKLQNPPTNAAITLADCAKWTQDVRTFNERVLKDHPAYKPIKDALFFNNINSILGYLQSVYDDSAFWSKINNNAIFTSTATEKRLAMYDVFISHANADKASYVDDLKKSLSKLNIQIFYDKDTLEWGDNWKNKILEGVDKAEFAIIVISENFFGREWTEKELTDFLSRQNRNGQKIILPILHNITVAQLQEKYPAVADIQALDSSKYSCDEIALKFAAQLIKRLKA